MTRWIAALAFAAAGMAAGPAPAATCHMTVQGVPVIDDQDCSAAGPTGDVRVVDEAGDIVRIRRSLMSARFASAPPAGGRRRGATVSYGLIVASSESDDKTCYFNQKAALCIDP